EDPTYQQAIEDLDLLLKVHRKATAYSALGKTYPAGYEQAVAILEDRIKHLEQMISHYTEERSAYTPLR
ncbi:hypothetical protein, partial [Legionella norrlandica]|uniref:hypothetical protein n=1 Tax=Legionella norrlandica TaxID=1498499 RepID=UPI00055CAFC7